MTDANANTPPKRQAAKKAFEPQAAETKPVDFDEQAQKGPIPMATQTLGRETTELQSEAAEAATRFSTELTDLAKGSVEAVVASASAISRAAVGFGDELIEYGRANFQQASASCRQLADVRSPADLFRLQSDYAKASLDIMMTESSRIQDRFGELMQEVAQSFTEARRPSA